jgi:hypothetical protein
LEAAISDREKRRLGLGQNVRQLSQKRDELRINDDERNSIEGQKREAVAKVNDQYQMGRISKTQYRESHNRNQAKYLSRVENNKREGERIRKDIHRLVVQKSDLERAGESEQELDAPRMPASRRVYQDPPAAVPDEKAGEVDLVLPDVPTHEVRKLDSEDPSTWPSPPTHEVNPVDRPRRGRLPPGFYEQLDRTITETDFTGADDLRDFYERMRAPTKKVVHMDHIPAAPVQIPIVPVQPIAPVYAHPLGIDPNYEERAWERFENFDHSTAIRGLITNNRHRQFFQYNPLTDDFEPRDRRLVHGADPGDPDGDTEIHQLQPHPSDAKEEESDVPLERIKGVAANLGEYITLKILPSALHIHIKKGVQDRALRLLAQRIIEHRADNTTRILLKRTRKGTFSYSQWINSAEMSKLNIQSMYERLLKITGGRKKSVTLVVRQSLRGGSIHEMWDTHHSLL